MCPLIQSHEIQNVVCYFRLVRQNYKETSKQMSGKPRLCGCKGYRSCLLCEQELNLPTCKEELLTEELLREQVNFS